MFDPYLAQREKEIDRLQAMARADRHRLAKQARGPRLSAWWRLHARVGAALRTLEALIARQRRTRRPASSVADNILKFEPRGNRYYRPQTGMAQRQDEAER